MPPNYLSGIFGGITLREWHQILGICGVEVAAPVANIGYVLPFVFPQLSLNQYLKAPPAVWISFAFARPGSPTTGTRVIPIPAPATCTSRETVRTSARTKDSTNSSPAAGPRIPATASTPSRERAAPRPRRRSPGVRVLPVSRSALPKRMAPSLRTVGGAKALGRWEWAYFPVLLSAIDPTQEARLLQLPWTVVSGRYLRENEHARFANRCLVCNTILPVLVGTSTYVDEPLVFDVERLRLPKGGHVLPVLEQPYAPNFVASLSGQRVGAKTFSSASMYAKALADWAPDATLQLGRGAGVSAYWSVGSVRYRVVGKDRLLAEPIRNPLSVWRRNNYSSGWFPAPPGSQDTSFRKLVVRQRQPDVLADR